MNHKEGCKILIPNEKLKALDNHGLLQLALQQDVVKNILDGKMPVVHEVNNLPERGAIILLRVEGVKVSEENTILSYTKKARQALSKQKRKKNETERLEQ